MFIITFYMKTKYLLLLGLVILFSCKEEKNINSLEQIINKTENISNAKKYIEENTFIDFDFYEYQNKLSSPKTRANNLSIDELSKIKASIYRVYSHTKIENGLFVCKLKSGKEINISEKLFKTFIYEFDKMNNLIKKEREKGVNLDLPPIDSCYLNSLLQ